MTPIRTLIDKFRRYITVGALNTVLNFLMMYLGSCLGLNYLVYTAIGYLTTIFLSFFMNLRYTFKVRDRPGLRLLGFMTVSFINLSMVECIEFVLIEYFDVLRWVAILLGMAWYVAVGFLVNNYVVYRHLGQKFEHDAHQKKISDLCG